MSVDDISWYNSVDCIELKYSSTNGRYLVASRDIKKEEVILIEYPYAWVVFDNWKTNTCRFCLGFINPPESSRKCKRCNQVYYCSSECQKVDSREHLIHECNILTHLDKQNNFSIPDSIYMEFLLLLRIISRKRVETLIKLTQNQLDNIISWDRKHTFDDFNKLISNVNEFNEDIIKNLKYWIIEYSYNMNEYIYNISNNNYKDSVIIESKNELLDIVCKNRLNGFAYGNGLFEEPQGYGIFINASMFNHSCAPNIVLRTLDSNCDELITLLEQNHVKRINSSGPLVAFTAARDIKCGEELLISYLDNGMTEPGLLDDEYNIELTKEENELYSLENRRKELKEHYLFTCKCERCLMEEKGKTYITKHKKQEEIIVEQKETEDESILLIKYQKLLGTNHFIKTQNGKVKFMIKGFTVQLNNECKIIQMAIIQIEGKDSPDHVPIKQLHKVIQLTE